MYEYLCYVEKNSYRKNSRNSLAFVPLNGVLIKKIPPKNRARPIAYSFASKYFNIHLHPSGKKISDLFNMVSTYFMIEQEML